MSTIKNFKRIFIILFILLQICFLPTPDARRINVFRVNDGKMITLEKMIDEIKEKKFIFIGESHDKAEHHKLQLEVIKKLKESGIPVAVGFEMFRSDSQEDLNCWINGTMSINEFIEVYYRNWNSPWPLYSEIFLYLRNHKITAIGLNLLPEITHKVAKGGFSSLTKEELEKLPPETGCIVNERYMRFIRRAYSMHGHRERNFIYFCQAQMLWDQVMAHNLVEFFKKNPDKLIIVLTGNGHAWKGGIPEQLKRLSLKNDIIVLLPQVHGNIDPTTITFEDADYLLF